MALLRYGVTMRFPWSKHEEPRLEWVFRPKRDVTAYELLIYLWLKEWASPKVLDEYIPSLDPEIRRYWFRERVK